MTGFGERLARAWDVFGRLCVGIDPHESLLEQWGLSADADGCREFGYRVVDACADVVGMVKPQVAFFERYGSRGLGALELVLARASQASIITIADAKRGDIGSTMDGYARAWLGEGSPLAADAVTLSPYLGLRSLDPALALARATQRGVFVLAVTTNPEARDVQLARGIHGGDAVAAHVAHAVARLREGDDIGYAGVVLGAATNLDEYGIDPAELAGVPILAPGFGAQGARVADARRNFGGATSTLIIAQSRSVLEAGPVGIGESVRRAAHEVADALA